VPPGVSNIALNKLQATDADINIISLPSGILSCNYAPVL